MSIARRFGLIDGSGDPKLKAPAIPQKPVIQADAALVARVAKLEEGMAELQERLRVLLGFADSQPTALYRHYGSDGQLFYVGISKSPLARQEAHSYREWSEWVSTVTIEWFPFKELALEAERNAIRNEAPIYNVVNSKSGVTPVTEREKRYAASNAERQRAYRARLKARNEAQ